MPTSSGGRFYTANGKPFYALITVGANPSANNVHDWGLPLVPKGALTTEIVTGWGPGDGGSTPSTDGSPLWVSAVADTTLYVDFDGDGGPSTAPNGQDYDQIFNIDRLQSITIADADHDNTGTRVFTVDGTLITGAWGQDPAVAGAGNPFLDMGTAVLPFPVPSIVKDAVLIVDNNDAGVPNVGDRLTYTLTINNAGLTTLPTTIVLDSLPAGLTYVAGTTTLNGVVVADDTTGSTLYPIDEAGFDIPSIPAGQVSTITYNVDINAAGTWVNTAILDNPDVFSEHTLIVPAATPNQCLVSFASDNSGTDAVAYSEGDNIFVKVTDSDLNLSNGSVESIVVTVNNDSNGDAENVTLIETGVATGVFVNTSGLASSATSGQGAQNGTLNAKTGDDLSVDYQDPYLGDSCSATISFPPPTQEKILYLKGDGVGTPDQDLSRTIPTAGSAKASETLGGGSAGSITVDGAATSGSAAVGSTTITFSHATGSGTDTLMLVGVSFECSGATCGSPTNSSVSSVSFNGSATGWFRAGQRYDASGDAIVEIWGLYSPPASTTANVVVTLNTNFDSVAGAITLAGVDQSQGQTLGFTGAVGSNTVPTVPVVSTAGHYVFGVASWDVPTGSPTAASPATDLWNVVQGVDGANGGIRGAASSAPGATSVDLNWTATASGSWAAGAVSITPSSTGNNTTTFTQTPDMAKDFVIPAGATIGAELFYNVISGTMPGGPNIDAKIQVQGGATIANLTATPANAGGKLTWTGAASGTTVAAGEVVELVITSNESGVEFTVQYDATTAMSLIRLPTTTVISVDSIAVYDAPYPNGGLVTSSNNGQTLYVRSTVSDPFGAYDINPAGDPMALAINNAVDSGCDIAETLDDGYVVDPTPIVGDEASKTYEYVWNTSTCEGDYTIAVTAYEGNEDTISDTKATKVNLSPLDLGTPSVIEFIDNAGDDKSAYGLAEQVCLRVTDVDESGSSTVSVVVTASVTSGNFPLTLVETSANSGVFEGCFNDSDNSSYGDDNPFADGDVLTGTYTDDDDPSDVVTDTAIVTGGAAPALLLSKALVAPNGGVAVVGDTVQYKLSVINSGVLTLNTVTLTDTFPSACYTFQSASVTPDSTTASSLTWDNVGPLTPGVTASIDVFFTATGACDAATATNRLEASGDATAGPVTATAEITSPSVAVTKTLTTAGTAAIGDAVSFDILIQNTGTTAITSLPLSDNYSTCLQFDSATPAATSSGGGVALWSNLGPLATSGSTTVTANFTVVGACAPAQNLAEVGFAVDENGKPVPSVQDTATLTTEAAKISGRVIDDLNANGSDDTEDGIRGVKVLLYSGDPNAGGILVATTRTDVDGNYEFPSVGNGTFFIVEQDPSGYVSTGDAEGANNNQIQVTIAALADSTGNDFLDVDSSNQGIALTKTVFVTGEAGVSCANATDQKVYVNSNRDPVDVTWCFAIENTGTLELDNPVVTDTDLGLTAIGQLTLISGSLPLQAGATVVYAFEETGRTSSLVNTATAEMDAGVIKVDDQNSATFAYVFDPPFGVKTGTLNGADRIRWTMVWINDSPINADGVIIQDQIDPAMTYIPGTLTCTPAGTTSLVQNGTTNPLVACSDAENFSGPDLITVTANFGPDLGATDAATAANELVISFEATIVNTGTAQTLENQGTSSWDPDGPGGAAPVTGVTDSDTAAAGAQKSTVVFGLSTPVPIMPTALLSLMALLLAGYGFRLRSHMA